MPIDPQALQSLQRWEDLQEKGEGISPEVLCADSPRLLPEAKRRIGGLQKLKPMLERTVEDDDGETGSVPVFFDITNRARPR